MLLAAPAIAAGTLVVAAPAYADDQWVALAATTDGSNVGTVGYGPTEQAAQMDALLSCRANANCAPYGGTENQCIALAVPGGPWGDGGGWATGTGPDYWSARAAALAAQAAEQGVPPGNQILAAGCSRREAPTLPGQPGPPTLPGGPPQELVP
jgi:Domain of unknown function (DUF4189)